MLAGTHKKLTLVSAPAGFGKTTLVGEWITHIKRPVAWVSLDVGDNDPARFWSYFIAALRTLENEFGKNALALLQSVQPGPIQSILTDLINEIAAFPSPFSLVLDDYQVIRSRSIQDALFFFVEHMPAQMHLVLITRTDPSHPLTRLRARNQLDEIRSDDLRFTLDETAEFLNRVMDLDLSPDNIAALEMRTEGWIAGLLLAAQSMQGRQELTSFIQAFTGNHRYIVGYLLEEVFSQRPKGTLDFLLRTSILERFCAPLCDAILEKPNSQAVLEMLERANLFLIPLDDQHEWFRYHHLFADVLRARLKRTQPGVNPNLHRRAAQWFEQNGLAPEAIQHAQAAQDFEMAARLIERIAPQTIVSGQIRTALGWLDSLPEELMLRSPNLCLTQAAALMYTNQLAAAEARLQDSERAIDSLQEEEPTGQRIIRGRLAIMRANLARIFGDMPACVLHANRSLDLLPESEIFWRASPLVHSASAYLLDGDAGPAREEQAEAAFLAARSSGNLFTHLRGITTLAHLKATQGCLHQAALTYRKVLDQAPGGLQGLVGSATYYFGVAYHFGLGSILYEWNDLDAAEQHLLQGVDLVESTLTSDADLIVSGYTCLARLRQARGDESGALAALKNLAEIGEQREFIPALMANYSAEETHIRLAQGDLQAAVRWAETSGLSLLDLEPPFSKESEYLILVQVSLARSQQYSGGSSLEDVIGLLDRLLQTAETNNRMGRVIQILCLRSMALSALGDFVWARESIFRALRLAESEGFLRTFVDQGNQMQRLLIEIAAGIDPAQPEASLSDEIARILTAFPGGETALPRHPQMQGMQPPAEYARLFTRREREVLQLVAEGASNQEIGACLVIAGPTVKRHMSNIFDKLRVNSRTQAVAQARKLGLLP